MLISNPLQQVVLEVDGADQFPVLDTDGFTKVSGLDPETFVVTVYLDGEVAGSYPAPEIVEIGVTGEYAITFETLQKGRLVIEVAIVAYDFLWKGFYDVVDPYVLPGQRHHGVVRDRRGNGIASVVVEVLDAGTATVLMTVQTDADGAYVIPLTGDLSTRRLVDLRLSGGANGAMPVQVLAGLVLA